MARNLGGSVYQRGNVWWVKYYRNGEAQRESCKGLTEAQARTKLNSLLKQNDDDFIEPAVKRVTVAELMSNLFAHYEADGKDDYLSMAKSKWVNHLKLDFESVRAHELGTKHMTRYRTRRMKAGAENATVNREFEILRRAYTLALEHEPKPLVKRVPNFNLTDESSNIRTGFVNITQLDKLRDAAKREHLEYCVLIDMGNLLGWRKGELLRKLTVGHIDLAANCVRLEPGETKNKDGREVGLTRSLQVLLAPMVLGREKEESLFKVAKYDFRRAWARITKAAGFPTRTTKTGHTVPSLLFHDLRRTSARAKRAAGVDSSVIMQMSGWKTDSVFRRYAIVDSSDMADAVTKQEAYEARQREEAAVLDQRTRVLATAN